MSSPLDPFCGLFRSNDAAHIARHEAAPNAVPDPATGRPLKVASVDGTDRSVCPTCAQVGAGGFVSFVSDLRLAYACPSCRKLVWLPGA